MDDLLRRILNVSRRRLLGSPRAEPDPENGPAATPAAGSVVLAGRQGSVPDEEGPIWLHLDHPALHQSPVLSGEVSVDGWAFADDALQAVEVWIDGQRQDHANLGQARPDVRRLYPDRPGAGRSGFSLLLDVGRMDEGPHEMEIRAVAADGTTRCARGRVLVSHTARAPEAPPPPDRDHQYRIWRQRNLPSPADLQRATESVARFPWRPRLSLLLVVSDADSALLDETLGSARGQTYPEWELVAIDDASPDGTAKVLDRHAGADSRIRLQRHHQPAGTGPSLQAALEISRGDLVVILGAEDLLSPLALHAVVQHLNDSPETDVVYADEDSVDGRGERRDPRFKPDWSPILLLSTNYLGWFVAYRRTLIDAAGGIDAGLSGAHAYDLSLRATEKARRVHHLAQVLYSVRVGDDVTATAEERRPFARGGSRLAIAAAAARRGIPARIEPTLFADVWRLRPLADRSPLVSILVPSITASHLRRCLDSVFGRTRYPNYEVLVLDTSTEGEIEQVVARLRDQGRRIERIHDPRRPFSFAAVNNLGAGAARGESLLLLNDDTEVLEPDWLDSMVELTRLPEVGIVGARLHYPSGRIQHAGIVLGICDIAGHAFRFFPADHPGYLRFSSVVREVSGVTFACALVTRETWDRLGGIDEANLPLSYNDVDFCLRAGAAGVRILYCPYARLLHFESASRRTVDVWKGFRYMRWRWRRELASDPFYNLNLTTSAEDWSLNLEEEQD